MLWVLGPAGVGKSAIAQTIAEGAKENGRLGAAFFFSRPNNRDHPSCVIPSLVYQFAVQLSDYKRLIIHRLANDPTILEKDLGSQFKLLIVEPFNVLRTKRSFSQPLLVILDGLDECSDKEAQCTFIKLISDHSRPKGNTPLIWMICSRPEWHLKRMLSKDFDIHCHHEELSVNNAEGRKDVYCFLCDGFSDIRRRFRNAVDDRWPSEDNLVQLASVSSGLFAFPWTVLKFVGAEFTNPISQLDICLEFAKTASASGTVNPLQALDLLYRQILSDIPPHVLPLTMTVISFRLMAFSKHATTPCDISNILGLSRATFYTAVQGLHSVLDIPDAEHGHEKSIRFYHASFEDFLRDPGRSGPFYHHEVKARSEIAIRCLRWHNMLVSLHCPLKGLRLFTAKSSI